MIATTKFYNFHRDRIYSRTRCEDLKIYTTSRREFSHLKKSEIANFRGIYEMEYPITEEKIEIYIEFIRESDNLRISKHLQEQETHSTIEVKK
jgi:hypothetical protein